MYRKLLFVSYLLFLLPALFILNFFLDLVTLDKIQGLPVFFPLLFSTLGVLFASKALEYKKSVLPIGAIVVNGILFMLPFIFLFFGTVIFGV
ncbi:hypothetical protein [Alkalihalobacillus sp. R86527]|uniref:hypothetical protein n=1 Tax=Alkalihalobacillus sp. R86527 TaxID=3093863 RepID=UPI00366AC235